MPIKSSIIGVQISDVTRISVDSTPFGQCLMIGSANSGNDRTLTTITSLQQFVTLFGNDSPSRKHVETFFLELTNSSMKLVFYKVNTGNTPAVVSDFTAALTAIDPLRDSGGILISPEVYEVLAIAQRKTFFDAAETFCDFNSGSLWVHLVDINPASPTATEADIASEKTTNYNSSMSGFCYYGVGFRSISNVSTKVMPSPAIAAYILSLWGSNNFSLVPANYARPLRSIPILDKEYRNVDTILTAGVNPLVKEDGIIYPFSALTATSKTAFQSINTVVCYKLINFYLARALRSFINLGVSGSDDLPSLVKAAIETELFTCYRNRRLLTGITTEDAYTVTVDSSNTSQVLATVQVRPTYANQRVTIQLMNLLGT